MKPLIAFAPGLAEKLFGRRMNPWAEHPRARHSITRKNSRGCRPKVRAIVVERRRQYHAACAAENRAKLEAHRKLAAEGC